MAERAEQAQRATRLRVMDPNGSPRTAAISMTGVPNANANAPLVIVVEQQCDLNIWHIVGQVDLPCWDSRG